MKEKLEKEGETKMNLTRQEKKKRNRSFNLKDDKVEREEPADMTMKKGTNINITYGAHALHIAFSRQRDI